MEIEILFNSWFYDLEVGRKIKVPRSKVREMMFVIYRHPTDITLLLLSLRQNWIANGLKRLGN